MYQCLIPTRPDQHPHRSSTLLGMRGRNNVTDKGQETGDKGADLRQRWTWRFERTARGAGPSPKLRLARPRLFSQGFPKTLAPARQSVVFFVAGFLIPASGAAIQRLLSRPCAQAVCYTRYHRSPRRWAGLSRSTPVALWQAVE
jgi:hypothetical protein